MARISILFILGLFCVGCVSNKARATDSITVAKLVKIKSYGECKMMPNGYLVCPKEGRR